MKIAAPSFYYIGPNAAKASLSKQASQIVITPTILAELDNLLLERGLDLNVATNITSGIKNKTNIMGHDSICWLAGPVVNNERCNILMVLHLSGIQEIPQHNIKISLAGRQLYSIKVHAMPSGHVTVFKLIEHPLQYKVMKEVYLWRLLSLHVNDLLNAARVIEIPGNDSDSADSTIFIPKRPMPFKCKDEFDTLTLNGADWVFQNKYDGQRLIMVFANTLAGRVVYIYSREGRPLINTTFDERFQLLAHMLSATTLPLVLEGEIMAGKDETFEQGIGHLRRYGTNNRDVYFFNYWSRSSAHDTYEVRFDYLKTLVAPLKHWQFYIVDHIDGAQNNADAVVRATTEWLDNDASEGIIVRHKNEQQLVGAPKYLYKLKKTFQTPGYMMRLRLGTKHNTILVDITTPQGMHTGTATVVGIEGERALIIKHFTLFQDAVAAAEHPYIVQFTHYGFTGLATFRYSPSITIQNFLRAFNHNLDIPASLQALLA